MTVTDYSAIITEKTSGNTVKGEKLMIIAAGIALFIGLIGGWFAHTGLILIQERRRWSYNSALQELMTSEWSVLKYIRKEIIRRFHNGFSTGDMDHFYLMEKPLTHPEILQVNMIFGPLDLEYHGHTPSGVPFPHSSEEFDHIHILTAHGRAVILRIASGDVPYIEEPILEPVNTLLRPAKAPAPDAQVDEAAEQSITTARG